MSVRVMSQVWDVDLPASQKIVLLALADCANDEGSAWPSIATLARKASKSERTVQAMLGELEAAGHITRLQIAGKGCRYVVHPAQPSGMQGYEPTTFHYVYRITHAETGEFYIGARSSITEPSDDPYMGSGKWVKEAIGAGAPLSKDVLETFPSREALAVGEERLTREHFGSDLCRNAKVATPGTLTKPFTPAKSAPRNNCAPQVPRKPPQNSHPTPAKSAPNPSLNHQEPSEVEAEASCATDAAPALKPEHVVLSWNKLAKQIGKPVVRDLTPERRVKLKARIAGYTLADWREVLTNIAASPFLRGDRDWQGCTFDWMTKKANFQKILEGNYNG